MEKEWKKIYVTTDFFRIEFFRQVLEEHGIKSVIMDKQGSPYRYGQFELYAHERDESNSISIINRLTEEGNTTENPEEENASED